MDTFCLSTLIDFVNSENQKDSYSILHENYTKLSIEQFYEESEFDLIVFLLTDETDDYYITISYDTPKEIIVMSMNHKYDDTKTFTTETIKEKLALFFNEELPEIKEVDV